MVEPCDSIGSPASHQQLVVVQAIVHTDNGLDKVVKIPPYVPLFLKRKSDRTVMQTDGIAHVSLLGSPRDFFGISTELFVAHHSRGESSNHMPVAISGLVTVATPNAEISSAGSQPQFGVGAFALSKQMKYEDEVCQVTTSFNKRPKTAYYDIGRYIRHLDQSYDGIAVILKGKPHSVSIADTAGALDDGPAEPAPAPVRAAPAPIPTSYTMSDSDDEPAVGGKRKSPAPAPADGGTGAGAAKRKKKGSRKKTAAAAPPAEADGTV